MSLTLPFFLTSRKEDWNHKIQRRTKPDNEIGPWSFLQFHIFYQTNLMQCFLFPFCFRSMNLIDFHLAQTMIFAIEEINNSSSLLPNISIGYRIYDSCGSTLSSMRAVMALMNGQERTVGKTCSGQSAVHAIIGASDSSSTIVMSRSTGAFQIPVVMKSHIHLNNSV